MPDAVAFAQSCAQGDFDLVIVEQQLRWAEGLALARMVKGGWPEVPVVMFTRHSDPELVFRAARLGVDQYLVKSAASFLRLPFTVETLLERGRAQPRPPAGAPERTTGQQPIPERAVRMTGPQQIPESGVRMTGPQPIPERGVRMTGPQPIPVGVRTTGPQPIPDRGVRMTGPQPTPERVVRMAELERSNQDLSRFAALAAHELQEPLRSMERAARVLKDDFGATLKPGAVKAVDRLLDGARGLQELIADLLSQNRLGGPRRPPRTIVVEELLAQVLENLDAAIKESGAKVTHEPLPTVRADPLPLVELLQNLIGNAIKYRGAEPPRIHVAASRTDGQWVFSVHDNGIGIDPAQAETLFTSFGRLRPDVPGSGLGLIICLQAVESLGGRIWVKSEPGQGSTFYFTLPDNAETEGERPLAQKERH